jgi:hypothetical protein
MRCNSHGAWVELTAEGDSFLLETIRARICPITHTNRKEAVESGGSTRAATMRKIRGKVEGWWSQRDLNPCLSLERAPS